MAILGLTLPRPSSYCFCALESHVSPCHEVRLLCRRNHWREWKRGREREREARLVPSCSSSPNWGPCMWVMLFRMFQPSWESRWHYLHEWPQPRPSQILPCWAPLILQNQEQIIKCCDLRPLTYFLKNSSLIFRMRGRERRKHNINQVPPSFPLLGIEPALQACAQTRN